MVNNIPEIKGIFFPERGYRWWETSIGTPWFYERGNWRRNWTGRVFFTACDIADVITGRCVGLVFQSYIQIILYSAIDQFSFKNVISLCPPCLVGFQKHDKRWVFQTMSYFSSGTGVCLGHCIIFCLLLEAPQVWRTPHSWNWFGMFTGCV